MSWFDFRLLREKGISAAKAALDKRSVITDGSVAVTASVFLLTELAEGWRLGVIDAMLDGSLRAKVGEDVAEIVVGHLAVPEPGHDRMERAGFDVAGAHDLDEEVVVVIADAAGIRGEVWADDLDARRTVDGVSACEQSGEDWSVGMIPTGVTSGTVGECGEILAALLGRGEVRRWDGSGDGLRHSCIADAASDWDAGLREVVAYGRN